MAADAQFSVNPVDWNMATRIGDDTRARIEAAWPTLLGALADGSVMAPHYAAAKVSADQVRVWRLEDRTGQREKEWQAAREQSADAYADAIVELLSNPGSDSGIARVKMDALRWLASKRNPRTYSDKQQLDVNVKTVDLTRIISDANARLAASRAAGRVLEGEIMRQAIAAPVSELDDLL